MSDFTALLQARNAYDLGGLYWTANLILSQTSVIACALLYNLYYEGDAADAPLNLATSLNSTSTNSTATASTRISSEQLKASIVSLITIFLISFTLFMLKMERKYVWTFFSTETGHGKAKRLFRTGKTDFEKSLITTNNKRLWTSIQGEVAEWLDLNWDRWERDKPDWFNTLFIASVDDDILPRRVRTRFKQDKEREERKQTSRREQES